MESFLREMLPGLVEGLGRPGVLFAEFEREEAARSAADDAWLASLSAERRRVVLALRRVDAVEQRYRVWWEEHVAWRFRAERPDSDGWDS